MNLPRSISEAVKASQAAKLSDRKREDDLIAQRQKVLDRKEQLRLQAIKKDIKSFLKNRPKKI